MSATVVCAICWRSFNAGKTGCMVLVRDPYQRNLYRPEEESSQAVCGRRKCVGRAAKQLARARRERERRHDEEVKRSEP